MVRRTPEIIDLAETSRKDGESQWISLVVMRRCGHEERLVVQTPVQYYVGWVAAQEICWRCRPHRPTSGRRFW